MSPVVSNDTSPLPPLTSFDGPALHFDLPGVRIGSAEYAEGPTGCTVFHFPQPALVATDIRGGMPGVFMGGDGPTDAICFAGGSLYGLEACSGVAAELFKASDYSVAFEQIALVRGGDHVRLRRSHERDLPRQGPRSGRPCQRPRRLVPAGASRRRVRHQLRQRPTLGRLRAGGQGAAALEQGALRVAVFVALNALGMVHDRDGWVVRGGLDRASGRRRSYLEQLATLRSAGEPPAPAPGNTTLTLVITNAALEVGALR